MLFLIAGLAVFLVFSGNMMSLKISRPFRRIIDTAVKVSNGDLAVFIPQPHYIKCAEAKNCDKIDCPAHMNPNRACWRIKGTLCIDGSIDVDESDKMEKCEDCFVYKKAMGDEIDELIEAINNMIQTLRKMVTDIAIQ